MPKGSKIALVVTADVVVHNVRNARILVIGTLLHFTRKCALITKQLTVAPFVGHIWTATIVFLLLSWA